MRIRRRRRREQSPGLGEKNTGWWAEAGLGIEGEECDRMRKRRWTGASFAIKGARIAGGQTTRRRCAGARLRLEIESPARARKE